MHPHTRALVCMRVSYLILGWEGWEGWEQVGIERLSPSQPRNIGREGWEQTQGVVMDDQIERMRRDFARVLAFRLASGEWGAVDADDIGLTIRAVIAGKDAALVSAWAAWCAAEAASYFGPAPSLPRALGPTACKTCRNLARLGPGYCAERPDLPPAYTDGHPLHQLPPDLGAACAVWRSQ